MYLFDRFFNSSMDTNRVNVFSNKIGRNKLKPGDHIYYWANPLFSHHGIYIGNGEVIHYNRAGKIFISSADLSNIDSMNGKVIKSTLDEFLNRKSLYLYAYNVSSGFFKMKRGGTCTIDVSDSPEMVNNRAEYLLHHGFGRYDLFSNNCEDFALYCKTGRMDPTIGIGGRSGQFSANVAAVGAGVAGGAIATVSTGMAIGVTASAVESAGFAAAIGSSAAFTMFPFVVASGFWLAPPAIICSAMAACGEMRYKSELERIEKLVNFAVEDLAIFRE